MKNAIQAILAGFVFIFASGIASAEVVPSSSGEVQQVLEVARAYESARKEAIRDLRQSKLCSKVSRRMARKIAYIGGDDMPENLALLEKSIDTYKNLKTALSHVPVINLMDVEFHIEEGVERALLEREQKRVLMAIHMITDLQNDIADYEMDYLRLELLKKQG